MGHLGGSNVITDVLKMWMKGTRSFIAREMPFETDDWPLLALKTEDRKLRMWVICARRQVLL